MYIYEYTDLYMHVFLLIDIHIFTYINNTYTYLGSVPDKIPIISERVKHRISICIDLYI
jgi:hypothetical protein